MNDHYVKILGARGSVPVSGNEFMQFGGATSSFFVNLSGTVLVVDAGSGLCKLTKDISELNRLDLLLTHLHLDHLLGLPLCPFILQKNKNLTIHMPESWSQDAEERLMRLFSPPFWPVTLNDLPEKIQFHRIKEKDYCGSETDICPGRDTGKIHFALCKNCCRVSVYISLHLQ